VSGAERDKGSGSPTIDELVVADEPDTWRAAGFDVDGDVCAAGTVRIRLAGAGAGRGIVGWSVRGVGTIELDGLPTTISRSPLPPPSGPHPNGAVGLDHVVVFSPELERTGAALESAGLALLRLREGPTPGGAMRQAFFRMAEVILEVIEQPDAGGEPVDRGMPAKLWGLAFRVERLEDVTAALGARLGTPRDAVQPGRRIATLRRSAGLRVPVAFITPRPPAAPT
jgi:hypothetical protein